MSNPASRQLVLILTFISGFSIMSVELLGGRVLAPYFGNSIYVWGSLITIFMLALALGYLMGGRWSTTSPSLKKFSLLYFLGSLALFPLVIFGNSIMEWVFLSIIDPRYGSFVAAILLFFVPTTLLGMIAPYSVRLLVSETRSSGQTAGLLYFISTLGSALGTLITSFYLVLWFDINTIIMSLMLFLFVGGICAYFSPSKQVMIEEQL